MDAQRYFLTQHGREAIEDWAIRNPKLAEVLDKEILKILKLEEKNGICPTCLEKHDGGCKPCMEE